MIKYHWPVAPKGVLGVAVARAVDLDRVDTPVVGNDEPQLGEFDCDGLSEQDIRKEYRRDECVQVPLHPDRMDGAVIEYLETPREAAVDRFTHRRVQEVIRRDRRARVSPVYETAAEQSIVADGQPVDLAAELAGRHAPPAWNELPARTYCARDGASRTMITIQPVSAVIGVRHICQQQGRHGGPLSILQHAGFERRHVVAQHLDLGVRALARLTKHRRRECSRWPSESPCRRAPWVLSKIVLEFSWRDLR